MTRILNVSLVQHGEPAELRFAVDGKAAKAGRVFAQPATDDQPELHYASHDLFGVGRLMDTPENAVRDLLTVNGCEQIDVAEEP